MRLKRVGTLALICLAMFAGQRAWAGSGSVLAKVDGIAVTKAEVKALLASRGIAQPNSAQMRSGLTLYIERMLLLRRARAHGLIRNNRGVQERLRELQANFVAQVMLQRGAGQAVTAKQLHQAYQHYVQQLPNEQYRLRAIVVQHKKRALELVKALKAGKRFTNLASEHSLPQYNAALGGELGWHSPNQLDPLIDRALVHMKAGQVVGPIWTHQRWWIIQLLQKRSVQTPSLQAVQAQLKNHLHAEAQRQYLKSLLKNAKIHYLGKNKGKGKVVVKPKLGVTKS